MAAALDQDGIQHKLDTNSAWVERAILALTARQTSDELASQNTKHTNGRGWNKFDAKFGTDLAGRIKTGPWSDRKPGGRLTGNQIAAARRMLKKYTGQLLTIVQEQAQKKPPIGHIAEVIPPEKWHPTFAEDPF